MDYESYREEVKSITVGKKLPDSVYVHISALSHLPKQLAAYVLNANDQFHIKEGSWNIIKFYKKDLKISFLNYPAFEDDSYPSLYLSQLVDLQKKSIRKSDYSKSANPPILHRKETFVSDIYPLTPLFKKITAEGEAIGLYEKKNRIGFKNNWERLIKSKGYYINDDGRLTPLTEKPITDIEPVSFKGNVERHKTAIDRNQLSQPMQVLARHNYLNGDLSVLDYGCGKGDDVRELEAHGLNVYGWDPVHRPDDPPSKSDLVNLGFVLNVIEDRAERSDTLLKAWQHTKKLLIVSVMLANDNFIERFTPYKDGIITSRNTFQKYYSQGEFRYYIESTLDENAIAAGQGIFIIFKTR